MHNGLLADPTNPFTKKIKTITDKGSKKMTESDHENRNRFEWEGGLYWHEDDGPIIPGDNIERCIQLGAQKSRIGKDVQAAVFCTEPHARLEYDGPRTKDKLYGPRFMLRKGVAVQKSRIIRMRPMFPSGWFIQFEIEFDEDIVDAKGILKACVDAGTYIGLGDWRPKFGRFAVELVE
jgi:hypothetical protein